VTASVGQCERTLRVRGTTCVFNCLFRLCCTLPKTPSRGSLRDISETGPRIGSDREPEEASRAKELGGGGGGTSQE
jgi:hypothetical protein